VKQFLLLSILLTSRVTLAQTAPPANEIFLRQAVSDVWDSLLADQLSQPFVWQLVSDSGHPGNWLVEAVLIEKLQAQHLQVRVGTSLAADSTVTSQVALRLGYRVIDLTLSYPNIWRKGFTGKKELRRQGWVVLSARLSDPATGEILFDRRASVIREDQLTGAQVREVENRNYPFLSPPVPSLGYNKYIEPIVVTGVVAALVLLLFTSR
jgi:hypothetical protein